MIASLLVVTGITYAYGFSRARARGIVPSATSVAFFAAALFAAAAVLDGPLDTLSDRSLSWHMVQHLSLAFVVVPLLLLGAPLRLTLAAVPARSGTRFAAFLGSNGMRFLTHPAVAWIQFAAVLYAAHFSPLYEAALEHPRVHALEHLLFAGSAVVFWTPILAVAPAPHAPAHIVRILMLFLALPMNAFLGFILYVTRAPLYAHYAMFAGALSDQQDAGAVMWLTGGAPLLVALLWCVADWGARERRLGVLTDRLEAR